MASKKTKRTRFVPQAILGTAFVGVIPACALALPGCGSDSGHGPTPDAGQFAVGQGVAVAAFFDSGQPDAGQFGVGQGVAVAAFFDSSVPDAGHDAAAPDANDEGGHDSGTG